MSDRDFFTGRSRRVENSRELWCAFMILWLRIWMSRSSDSQSSWMLGMHANVCSWGKSLGGRPSPFSPSLVGVTAKLPHGQVSWSEAALGFTDLPLSLNFSLTLPATRPQCSHSHWLMEASLPAVGIMRLRCVQPGADPQNTSKWAVGNSTDAPPLFQLLADDDRMSLKAICGLCQQVPLPWHFDFRRFVPSL